MKKDEIKEIKEVDESVVPSSLDLEGGSLEDGSNENGSDSDSSDEEDDDKELFGVGTVGPKPVISNP